MRSFYLLMLCMLLAAFSTKALSPVHGFVENKGQWSPDLHFQSKSQQLQLSLTSNGLHYFFPNKAGTYRLDLKLIGSRKDVKPEAFEPLAYYENHLVSQKSVQTKAYKGVRYPQVYPGIDWVVFYDKQGQLKYEFHLAPGANPALIKFTYDGGKSTFINNEGALIVQGPHGELQEAAPVSWLAESGQAVGSAFKVNRQNEISFDLGQYDAKQHLVIDPLVSWLTLVGGNGSYEDVTGVYVNEATQIRYVCGYTNSTDMATAGVHQTSNTDTAGFVAAYNALGQKLWTSYLGGNRRTELRGIIGKTSPVFELYVVGITNATSGIASSQAFQTVNNGKLDGVIARFNDNGSLVWSTYFGGSEDDLLNAVAVIENSVTIAVAGGTNSTNGISTPGTLRPNKAVADGTDGFVAIFDRLGQRSVGTYVGGNADEEIRAIAADQTTLFVAGWTTEPSTNYHASGGYQNTFGGQIDGFVQRINTGLTLRFWGTYVGGTGQDEVNAIALTPTRLYIGGRTASSTNISTPGAAQVTRFNSFDAFLIQLSLNCIRQWGTYFGGLGSESIQSLSPLSTNNGVVAAGFTTSANLGLNGFQNELIGTQNAFISNYTATGAQRYATYLGSGNNEVITSITNSNNGERIIVGGRTNGGNLATLGADRTQGVGQEGFLATICEPVYEITGYAPSFSAICPGEPFGYRIYLGPQFTVGDTVVVDLVYISGVSRRVDTIVFSQADTLTRFFTLPAGVYPSPARLRPFLLRGLQAGNWFPSNTASQGFPIRERVRIITQPSVSTNLSCSPTTVNLSFAIALGSVGPYTISWLKGDSVILQTTSITTLGLQGTSSAINGTYRAVISSGCGSDTSVAVVVNVPEPPRFTRQATASRQLCLNERFVLKALSQTNFDSIVFFRGNQRVQGGLVDSLVIANVTAANVGNYWYRIHNRCGQVNADTVQLSLAPALAFSTQPSGSRTYCVGSPLNLTAQLNIPQANFRWFKNGQMISGATTSGLSFTSLAFSDSGRYVLQAFTACDTITSDTVTIGVSNPINFMGSISGATQLCIGANGSLLQAIQGSIAAAQFSWFKNGQLVPAQTGRVFNFTNFSASDVGNYVLRMITPCDTLFSDTVRMSLIPAVQLLMAPQVRPAYCIGSNVEIKLSARNAFVQWFKDGQILLPSPAIDTALRFTNITTANNGSYFALLIGGCDTLRTDTFNINVVNTPIVTLQPQGGSYCLGSQVASMPSLQNLSSGTYQWFKNGQAVAGATSRTLFFNSFAAADTGRYILRIASACDTSFTDTVQLNLLAPVQIRRQLVQPAVTCAASPLQLRFTATNASIQWYRNGQQIPPSNTPDSFLVISSSDTGMYHALAVGVCGTISSDTIQIRPLAAPIITQQPVGGAFCQGTNVILQPTIQYAGQLSYQWFQNGLSMGNRNTLQLNLLSMGSNFSGDFVLRAISNCGDTVFTNPVQLTNIWIPNITAQSAPVVTVCAGNSTNLQVTMTNPSNLSFQWFKNGQAISGANSNQLSISNASAVDTGLYRCIVTNQCASDTSEFIRVVLSTRPLITSQPTLLNGCWSPTGNPVVRATVSGPVQEYRWLVGGQPVTANADSIIFRNVAANFQAQVQLIAIGSCGNDTSALVNIALSQPFQITAQPSPMNRVCVGSSLPLTVLTNTASSLNYQWFFNGQALTGATAATLNLNSISASDTGSYYCIVSNSCLTDTTQTTRVIFENPVLILSQPSPLIGVCAGSNFPLTVAATGGSSLIYQWFLNGQALIGATNATLNVNNISASDTGSYYCIVSNSCFSDTTQITRLTFENPVLFTQQPQSANICAAPNSNFVVRASAQGTITGWQWLLNGAPQGVNADTFVVNTSIPGIRQLRLVAFGLCGNDTSQVATITVLANSSSQLNASVCAGDVYAFFGQQLAVAGTYNATIPNAAGCDSTITLQLAVNQSPQPTISQQGFVLSTDSFATYQWQLNGTDLPGATARSLNATANGTYRVRVRDSLQCEGQSPAFNLTGVSVIELNKLQWQLYPVPAKDWLKIELDGHTSTLQAQLRNSHGQLIRSLQLENGSNTIDISQLADGVYFIECEGQVKRFIRQH
ncbi:MAG: immunoglobulin domain-containing protein [Sphingobacteriaceae bacterium]|nr:immunoglobulin domain-containing protein [Sphingobacteriaceae bacterium]